MSFDKNSYIQEKSVKFVSDITNDSNPKGIVGFKSSLKYYLSTMNNEIDKRAFVNFCLDIFYSFSKEDQDKFSDFIYILNGYVS